MWDWGILQLAIIAISIYNFGFIYGIIYLIAAGQIIIYILKQNGLTIIPFSDLIVMNEPGDGTNSIVSYVEFGKCSFDDFKQRVYEKGILRIPKLHSVVRNYLGFMLWKEVDPRFAKTNIKECEEDIHDYESLRQYCEKLQAIKLDPTEIPWRIDFIQNFSKDTSMMVWNNQHSQNDAAGFVSFISAILDNQFELRHKKHVEPLAWFLKPIYFIIAIFYFGNLSGKMQKIKSDEDTAKIREENGKNTFMKNISMSEELDFKAIRKAYKSYGKGVTFGDYFMGVTSVGLKRWYDQYGHKKAAVGKMAISVNRRDLPTSYEDLLFCNYVGVFQIAFPILSNLKEAIEKSNKALWEIYSDFGGRCAEMFMYYFCFMPKNVAFNNMDSVLEGCDLGISNIQFGEQKWKFLGKGVKRRGMFASGREQVKLLLFPVTYEDKLSIQMVTNKSMKMDNKALLKHIVDVIEEDIAKNGS